jgi:hypothetical protein
MAGRARAIRHDGICLWGMIYYHRPYALASGPLSLASAQNLGAETHV